MGPVGEDADEPGLQRPRGVVGLGALDSDQEGLLDDILSKVPITDQALCEPREDGRNAVEHLGQRNEVARVGVALEQRLEVRRGHGPRMVAARAGVTGYFANCGSDSPARPRGLLKAARCIGAPQPVEPGP